MSKKQFDKELMVSLTTPPPLSPTGRMEWAGTKADVTSSSGFSSPDNLHHGEPEETVRLFYIGGPYDGRREVMENYRGGNDVSVTVFIDDHVMMHAKADPNEILRQRGLIGVKYVTHRRIDHLGTDYRVKYTPIFVGRSNATGLPTYTCIAEEGFE